MSMVRALERRWSTAIAAILLLLVCPRPVQADLFGGDVVVLSQILVQTLQQLAQLRQILATSQDNLGLLREINQGINDSLNLIQTSGLAQDPGLYGDWQKTAQALDGLHGIYGQAAPSKDLQIQKDADQSAAEAIALNNAVYSYTVDVDQIAEKVKSASHAVSPGGAQKLTAESLGVMLQVMNQNLRAQATSLKLQAQNLAIENKKDKDRTRQLLSDSNDLKSAMQSTPVSFNMPRF